MTTGILEKCRAKLIKLGYPNAATRMFDSQGIQRPKE